MSESTGAERIADERHRQKCVEGYTTAHDAEHTDGALTNAASMYLNFADWQRRYPDHPLTGLEFLNVGDIHGLGRVGDAWPWRDEDFKPADRVRNLEKAGALIAAEIDRLSTLA